MSNDIATTDNTNDDTNVAKSVALDVSKELAITAIGCVAALALTAGATRLVNKVHAIRARRAYDRLIDTNASTN